MSDDIKSLREEFDNLRKQNQECEEGCETDFEEDFPDYIIEITTKLLSPNRCGVYISKRDIKEIAAACDEKIAPKQRQRMLTDTLKSVFKIEEMEHLFNTIKSRIDTKLKFYEELSAAFPASKTFFTMHHDKAEKFKSSLDRILAENKES